MLIEHLVRPASRADAIAIEEKIAAKGSLCDLCASARQTKHCQRKDSTKKTTPA
jgi:hypothetical protein